MAIMSQRDYDVLPAERRLQVDDHPWLRSVGGGEEPVAIYDRPDLEHGPYTRQQVLDGQVSIADSGRLWGYLYQVERLEETFTPGVYTTSAYEPGYKAKLPVFRTGDKAVAYLLTNRMFGRVLRYVRPRPGESMWITAGCTFSAIPSIMDVSAWSAELAGVGVTGRVATINGHRVERDEHGAYLIDGQGPLDENTAWHAVLRVPAAIQAQAA